MSDKTHYKYVIVGAGISALQAALILAQHNQDFVVLEASDRVGGRICSQTLGESLKDCPDSYEWLQTVKSDPIECGGTWICEDNTFLLTLIAKFGLNLTTQYYEGLQTLAESPQRYYHVQELGEYYNKYETEIKNFLSSLSKLRIKFEELCDKKTSGTITPIQEKELGEFYATYDTMSAFDYIKQHLKDEFLTNLLAKETETLQCCKASQFSVIELFSGEEEPFSLVKYNLGIQNANIDGFRLREGMSRVYERINAETQKIFNAEGKGRNIKDLIKLNCPVTEIRNGNVPVQVVTKVGVTYTCEKVIMSLPVATFHRIKFESLSTSKRLLVENQLECNMTRMALVFKEPFWRKQNYSGSVLFSHNFPMNELVDLTPDSQAYGVLAFAFTADGFKRWNQQILSESKSNEVKQLKRQWYQINKRKVLRIIADLYLDGDLNSSHLKEVAIFAKSLSDNEYIKSSYQSIIAKSTALKIYNSGEFNIDAMNDEVNITIIGSDFSEEFNGYIEGGIRIARKKIYSLCGQQDPLEYLGTSKTFSKL